MSPVDLKFAQAVVDGEVELLGIDEIVKRLGVSRSTLERWVRNGRNTIPGMEHVMPVSSSLFPARTNFPAPDIYIGASPKWSKDTVVKWLMANSTK